MIKLQTENGIAHLEIARPEKKNAITVAMYQQLADGVNAAQADDAVRAVLIHGSREIFTAGNDLEDFMKNRPSGPDAPVFQFMRALAFAEKPVIAAVNGAAVGIGTTMLLHCDLVYCADDAKFSMPFVSLGLCPEFASSLLLPLTAGYHKAAEKLLLADPISAEEALEMKIVNRIVPPGEVLDYARAQAARFATLPPASVRESKRLLKAGWRAMVEKTMIEEAATFSRLLTAPEAKEAFTAFFERRKPDFSKLV
ncbi:MAG TPA: enoyl-CoA hydratase [Burkholderiaceae bacterium]|nr:enoyl-CoA hydratase [Burkholderiaceae bacterium]